MGLDMYLTGEKFFFGSGKRPRAKEDGFEVEAHRLRLGYWRKHPDLHGYIVQTFAGGRDECQEIELGGDDLNKIINAIDNDELPHTEGFFFGASENDAEQKRHAIDIFVRALAWLEDVEPMPEPEKMGEVGGVMVAFKIEPGTIPDEMRSVSYRASW